MARSDVNRDAAGIGPHHRPGIELTPLGRLDWKIADGDADIRGWEVRTVGGRRLGAVKELLVDRDSGEVVLMDIDLDGTDRHSLAPLRMAQIDRTLRVVRLDSGDLIAQDIGRDDAEVHVTRRAPADVPLPPTPPAPHAVDAGGSLPDAGAPRTVRYLRADGTEAAPGERAAVIEEVVVRRRVVEP